DMAERQLKKQSLSSYYDAVAMTALALGQTDAAHGKLSHDKQLEICHTVEEVVEDLNDHEDKDPEASDEIARGTPVLTSDSLHENWRVDYPVLCVASRSPLDQAASTMLAQLLGKHGLPAHVQPFTDVAS